MRIRRLTSSSSTGEAINVTPLIDVVMCLIIFFLIVGKLAATNAPGVSLPASARGDEEPGGIAITVSALTPAAPRPRFTGSALPLTITVDGESVITDADLLAAIRKRTADAPSAPVKLRADRELPYAAVTPVLRACKEAGLTSIGLVTERIPGEP